LVNDKEFAVRRKTSVMRLGLALRGLMMLLAAAACTLPSAGTTAPTAPATAATFSPAIPTSVPKTPASPISASETPALAATQPADSGLPVFSHIDVIVMENKEYGDIVGSAHAPYLNSLIAQYGLATNYTGITHPSEPNYFALFSGSTQGATNDGVYNLDGENLADQLEAKGKTWKVFAENAPTNCFTDILALGGEDGPGLYVRKHNPAISFTDISHSPERCANITDLTHFDPAAANYALIVPNQCHDMHDCSVATGDDFLKGFVPKILNSRAWQDGGALFITWDEGSTSLGGGGQVPLLVISNRVPKGFRSSVEHNHYSLLRAVEDAWGLGCLNQACAASSLEEFFR
jgi:hypothetical protein